jgi:hypothetical protein
MVDDLQATHSQHPPLTDAHQLPMPLHLHALRGLLFGAFFQGLGIFLRLHGSVRSVIIGSVIAMVLATLIFVRGCMYTAQWRGRTPWLGLLGLLTVAGVAKLSLLWLFVSIVVVLAVIWYRPAQSKAVGA